MESSAIPALMIAINASAKADIQLILRILFHHKDTDDANHRKAQEKNHIRQILIYHGIAILMLIQIFLSHLLIGKKQAHILYGSDKYRSTELLHR